MIEQFVPPEYSPGLHFGWVINEGRVHWKYQYHTSDKTHERCAAAYEMATMSNKLKLMKLFEFVIRESVKARLK